MVSPMKTSAEIFSSIEHLQARIRQLHGEGAGNEPRRFDHRPSREEELENERRRARADQIRVEITTANAEAACRRKDYAQALASERAPKSVGPSPALQA